jgi:hypothetical protein
MRLIRKVRSSALDINQHKEKKGRLCDKRPFKYLLKEKRNKRAL